MQSFLSNSMHKKAWKKVVSHGNVWNKLSQRNPVNSRSWAWNKGKELSGWKKVIVAQTLHFFRDMLWIRNLLGEVHKGRQERLIGDVRFRLKNYEPLGLTNTKDCEFWNNLVIKYFSLQKIVSNVMNYETISMGFTTQLMTCIKRHFIHIFPDTPNTP